MIEEDLNLRGRILFAFYTKILSSLTIKLCHLSEMFIILNINLPTHLAC